MNRYQVFSSSSESAGSSRRLKFCPNCGARFADAELRAFERQTCDSCGYKHYLNPYPGITIIIHDDDAQRVLIAKRSEETEYGGLWCLPGGYIEYEESFLEATAREVAEETGLRVEIKGIINVVSNLLDDVHHTLVVVLLGRALGGNERPGDDVAELTWVTKEEHARVDYAFEADRRIIDGYFEGNLEAIPIDRRYSNGAGQPAPAELGEP